MALNIFDAHPIQSLSSLMTHLSWPDKANLVDGVKEITHNLTDPILDTSYIALAYTKDLPRATFETVEPVLERAAANPTVQTAIKKKEAAVGFTNAALATMADKSKPLASVPKPEIGHKAPQYSHFRSHGSKETIIYGLGHATPIEDMEEFIEEAYQAGIDLIIVPLPEMFGHTHAADGRSIDKVYDDHMAAALGPNSPIYNSIPKHHSISLFTHSSSGASFERVAKRDDNFAMHARARFSNILHQGAFLETVGSSFLFNPGLSKTYSVASRTPYLKDKRIGSTPMDRHHTGIPDDIDEAAYLESLENNAEHGQAYFLKKAAQKHLKSIIADNERNSHFQQMERTFVSGTNEGAACYKTVKRYSDVLVEGAETEIVEGAGHNLAIHKHDFEENSSELRQDCAKFRQRIIDITQNGKQPRVSMDEAISTIRASEELAENSWLTSFKASLTRTPANQPQVATATPSRAPQAA